MKSKIQSPLSRPWPNEAVTPCRVIAKKIAASVGIVACALALYGAAAEGIDLSQLAPEVYEWYPYEPMAVAVGEAVELFGDVDDFGGGAYTCTWESDRGPIETQVMETAGADWIHFKTTITYRPTGQDVGARTITLTVQDPDGHTTVQSYAIDVTRPSQSKGSQRHGR